MRLLIFIIVLSLSYTATAQDGTILQNCPGVGLQPRSADFEPTGIILTYFDRDSLWVYNIARNSRYPLPDTAPCGANCHLSYDARWITYLDANTRIIGKMRLDGTQRTPLASNASEVSWWSPERLLIWTPTYDAYIRDETSDERQPLNVQGVISVQPGGLWGVLLEQQADTFGRYLVNLEMRDLDWLDGRVFLGAELTLQNAMDWSPDGEQLAFIATPGLGSGADVPGAEVYLVRPGDAAPTQITDFTSGYGPVRINGHSPSELRWSPDGTRIAFWVTPLDAVESRLHIFDLTTNQTTVYCDFNATESDPNPPRLIWSPDGTHISFGANVPGDARGYLLLVLDTASGVFTELSTGIYPAMGRADVVAWGLAP